MKKITALLTALMCVTAIPLGCAHSEVSTEKAQAEISETNTSELQKLTSSLGADSDHFSFIADIPMTYPPYTSSADYRETIEKLTEENGISYDPMKYTQTIRSDCSIGMAILQTAVHNGDIEVSDIKVNAGTLADVEFDTSVNQKIFDSGNEFYRDRKMRQIIGYELCNSTADERMDKLIETAENAQKSGKYFFIILRNQRSECFQLGLTGIGITDGKWEFNGNNYDKCILTLDPVGDMKNKTTGFSEDACIYVNSKTKEYVVPRYIDETDEKYARIDFVTADSKMLLERGANVEIPEKHKVITVINEDEYAYDLTVNNDGVSTTYHGDYVTSPEDLSKTPYNISGERGIVQDNVVSFMDADSISIDTYQDEDAENYGDAIALGVGIASDSCGSSVKGHGLFKADITKDKVVYEHKPTYYYKARKESLDKVLAQANDFSISFNEKANTYPEITEKKLGDVKVAGKTTGTVTFEKTDGGYLISDANGLEVKLYGNPYNKNRFLLDEADKVFSEIKAGTTDESTAIDKYFKMVNGSEISITGPKSALAKFNWQNSTWDIYIAVFISISAQNKDELEELTKFVKTKATKFQVTINYLNRQQEKGMNSILPLGVNHLGNAVSTYLLTDAAAVLIPFSYRTYYQDEGVFYGINKVTNSAIILDRTEEMNANGYVLGPSGSGKSMFVKMEMMDVLFKYPTDEIIIIDPENEYGVLTQKENFDGEVLKLSPNSPTKYNIFDIDLSFTEEGRDAVAVKSEFIMTVVETAKGYKLTSEEKSILDRCIHLAYYDYQKSEGEDQTVLPTLTTLYNILQEQEEPEAKQLALVLELYVTGSLRNFADKTNIDTSKRLLIIDIHEMGEQLRAVGLQIVLEFVWQRVVDNKKKGIRTWLWCDEFSMMFNDEEGQSGKFFMKVFSRIRKYGGVATGITQNIKEVLASREASSMLSNAKFKILLPQDNENLEKISEMFRLSPSQEAYLNTEEKGTGLIICGSKIIPFDKRIADSGRVYEIISTNFKEYQKKHRERENE